MRPHLVRLVQTLVLAAAALAASAGCTEGLANAPGPQRRWTPQDFEHDVVANGPESCPKDGSKDPLALRGERRRVCAEKSPPAGNAPATR